MRIGLVLSSTPNYSETFFVNKIKGLQAKGYSVKLFVQNIKPDFFLCEVSKMPKVYKNKFLFCAQYLWILILLVPHINNVKRFYKYEKASGSNNTQILKLIYLNSHILKAKLDWLHFGFATQAVSSELVAKAIDAKMAVSFRGFDINVYPKKHKNCYIKLWENVDKVHSISNYLLNEAYGLGLNREVPFSIITPAIDSDILNGLRKPLKFNDNLTICTVARLNWIKDLTTAIKTISLLKKDYPSIKYEIIGDGTKKDTERYKYQVYQLGLDDNVIFYNRLSHNETLEKVSNCDIYLQTSLNEGFCNAVLEAQALGKLSVASDVGGLKENIINNKTGWLVSPKNAESFASKIIKILEMSDSSKEVIIDNAINRVKEQFTMDIQRQKFIDFYKF